MSPEMTDALSQDPMMGGAPEVDPAQEEAELAAAAEEANPDPTVEAPDESEAAKIAEFEQLIEVPTPYQQDYGRFAEDREYVQEMIESEKDDEDTVLTNYILRNQRILVSQLFARDPAVAVRATEMLGGYPPTIHEFAKTCELLVPRLFDECAFRPTLTGMLQDVQTHGIAWLKISTQVDVELDPIGCRRQNDQLDNIARLGALLTSFNEEEFDEESAQYKDLVDLSDTVRAYLAGQIQADLAVNPPAMLPPPVDPLSGLPALDPMGMPLPPEQDTNDPRFGDLEALGQEGQPLAPETLPEVAHFIGFNLDPIQPEDVRFDWDLTRPEDFYSRGLWWAHRVPITLDVLKANWGHKLDEDDYTAACSHGKKSAATAAPTVKPDDRSDLEAREVNSQLFLWEMWDKRTGRRYVWVPGTKKFLINEVPKHTWRHFFPVVPLIFNRVTGKFLGPSDVRLQMPLQDEINLKRTHEREAQKGAYPKWLVGQGMLSPEEKSKVERALPYSVIELKKAEDVNKSMSELKTSFKFDPILYDTTRAQREMEYISGITAQAAGQTGTAELATEVAVANEQQQVQADYRKSVLEEFIAHIATALLDMSVSLFTEEHIKQMLGVGAVWPPLDREHLWRLIGIRVTPGTAGMPDKAKELEMAMQILDVAGRCGVMLNGPEVFKWIVTASGVSVDLQKLVIDPVALQAMGMPLPPGAIMPGAPAAGDEAGGAGPGAPPMQDRAQAPGQASIPNRPGTPGQELTGAP